MSLYTQILARTERPTQVLSALKNLDVYMFPHSPAGSLICEKSSAALDVRIVIQAAKEISWKLGRGCAVLAIAGDSAGGFWCRVFDGGERRFEHNRLTGPRDFTEKPASRADVDLLCGPFGAEVDRDAVYEILTSGGFQSAVERHAALAQALGLPAWSPGIGYCRCAEGSLPPAADKPGKPVRSLAALAPVIELPEQIKGPDTQVIFQEECRRSFGFLKNDFGFQEKPARLMPNRTESPIHRGVYLIGPMHRRPGYRNPYTMVYRSPYLIVVIEGLSFGTRTRLCLIDRAGRHLDFTRLAARRAPALLDLCRLAEGQREQVPIFGDTLRECAVDVLSGDLGEIPLLGEREPGFSFDAFGARSDSDYILSAHGPRLRPRTLAAQVRRAQFLLKQEYSLLRSPKKKAKAGKPA